MTDALLPLRELEDMFVKAVEAKGGRVMFFGVRPGQRQLMVMMELDDDLFLDDEGKKFKSQFEDIEKHFHIEQKADVMEEKITEISDLEKRLAEGGDIL